MIQSLIIADHHSEYTADIGASLQMLGRSSLTAETKEVYSIQTVSGIVEVSQEVKGNVREPNTYVVVTLVQDSQAD